MRKKKIVFSLKEILQEHSNYGVNEYFFSASSIAKKEKKIHLLSELEDKVRNCQLCPLFRFAQNSVFGEGNANARLMFVGEGPGGEEDNQGRPFVGQAGKLLTKIIEAMGYKREEVYIANIVKHRPPLNRNPLPEEIHACLPFLLLQIKLIKPKVICALGKIASSTLLGDRGESISQARGEFNSFELIEAKNPIEIMPTYHPAYLLRNPKAKRDVWSDMKKVMKYLGKK